ncbi:MAG: hypothetical protein JW751_18805 [Polyangiaceae bacterium]|nr:hypothetical protein [Polyangiaceae bacterium]
MWRRGSVVAAGFVLACAGSKDQRVDETVSEVAGHGGERAVVAGAISGSGAAGGTAGAANTSGTNAGASGGVPGGGAAGGPAVEPAGGIVSGAGMSAGGASGAEPSDAGASGAGASSSGGCSTAEDCPLPLTVPEDCAEARCLDAICSYVGVDADHDGFRVQRCTSRTPGIAIETGEDCDDGDDSVSPNGWDGPAGDGFADGCNDNIDQDCSGLFDDGQLTNGATCTCNPGESGSCTTTESGVAIAYPVIEGGQPVGACSYGARECLPNGTWGACTGAIGPAPETCDGDDNDCDGVASAEDLDVIDRTTFVCDGDLDNHAPIVDIVSVVACVEPATGCDGQWLSNPGVSVFDDCEDTDPQMNPEETETCNGKDDDCDGDTDEAGALGETYWSYDADGDSYRDQTLPTYYQCHAPGTAPEGCAGECPSDTWVSRASTPLPTNDCDDGDPQRNPSATDPCNGVDDLDCDGSPVTGCPCSSGETQPCGEHPGYDGIGICHPGEQICSAGSWGSCVGAQGPEAEVCGTQDRDCDGTPGNTDASASDRTTWVCDGDKDGRLAETGAVEVLACSVPAASACNGGDGDWVANPGDSRYDDCDDTDADIWPQENEVCDGKDNDCDDDTDAEDSSLSGTPQNPGVSYACQDGAWVITHCPTNALHCDGNVDNGCETDATSLTDCHACNNACAFACGASDCEEILRLELGSDHSCAITGSGAAVCWGRNDEGRLGDDTSTEHHAAEPVVTLVGFAAIAAGHAHTCGIAGTPPLSYCWGSNASQQLGLPSNGQPGGVASADVPRSLGATVGNVQSMAAGGEHGCAVQTDGSVRCWGLQTDGRLGNGVTNGTSTAVAAYRNPSSPALIGDATVVTAGFRHTCIINAGGTVECWGDNASGQLGDGSFNDGLAAVDVVGLSNVTAITAGTAHTCALSGTTMHCWGDNAHRQLGPDPNGNALPSSSYNTPQPVGLTEVTAIAAGGAFTCAVATGQVRCWGHNTKGQRGDTSYGTSTHTPTSLSLPGITGIWAGGEHVCALRRDAPVGKNDPVYCWGSNAYGQLGIGSKDNNNHPTPALIQPLD